MLLFWYELPFYHIKYHKQRGLSTYGTNVGLGNDSDIVNTLLVYAVEENYFNAARKDKADEAILHVENVSVRVSV